MMMLEVAERVRFELTSVVMDANDVVTAPN
jgi:hypothetical protein